MAKNDDILTMPLKDLQKNVAQVQQKLAEIEDLLPGLAGLTPDARKHASKFRAGEADALSSVLDAADANTEMFQSLANRDDGDDPNVFETDLLRDRVARVAILAPLVDAFSPIAEGVSDTVLHLSDLSKPVMLLAYGIAKAHAKLDGVLANTIRNATEFYAKIGRATAATKKKSASNDKTP
jgi:hypothetical protein